MIPINRKFFEVIAHDFKTGKSRSLGIYRLSSFTYVFGEPEEREIFDQAVSNGKMFITKYETGFELKTRYLYNVSEEALEEEYNAIMDVWYDKEKN